VKWPGIVVCVKTVNHIKRHVDNRVALTLPGMYKFDMTETRDAQDPLMAIITLF